MSFRDAIKPQDLGPERLKPAEGAPILDPSVEAEGPAPDLCSGRALRETARERILVWLAEGVREVTWALCSIPRERWAATPPLQLGDWPALRHLQHLTLRESQRVLPAVQQALGEPATDAPVSSIAELEQIDAVWGAASTIESAEVVLQRLGQTRFELLQRLEAAPDALWQHPLDATVTAALGQTSPVQLDWLLLSARQHELQHLAAIWNIALKWDRVSLDDASTPGVPLHPADRLEESH
jgi:hypothetical protein